MLQGMSWNAEEFASPPPHLHFCGRCVVSLSLMKQRRTNLELISGEFPPPHKKSEFQLKNKEAAAAADEIDVSFHKSPTGGDALNFATLPLKKKKFDFHLETRTRVNINCSEFIN